MKTTGAVRRCTIGKNVVGLGVTKTARTSPALTALADVSSGLPLLLIRPRDSSSPISCCRIPWIICIVLGDTKLAEQNERSAAKPCDQIVEDSSEKAERRSRRGNTEGSDGVGAQITCCLAALHPLKAAMRARWSLAPPASPLRRRFAMVALRRASASTGSTQGSRYAVLQATERNRDKSGAKVNIRRLNSSS